MVALVGHQAPTVAVVPEESDQRGFRLFQVAIGKTVSNDEDATDSVDPFCRDLRSLRLCGENFFISWMC